MEIASMGPLFPLYCGYNHETFMCRSLACQHCRSGGVVRGRFGATRGPQKPSPETGAVEPRTERRSGIEPERLWA